MGCMDESVHGWRLEGTCPGSRRTQIVGSRDRLTHAWAGGIGGNSLFLWDGCTRVREKRRAVQVRNARVISTSASASAAKIGYFGDELVGRPLTKKGREKT